MYAIDNLEFVRGDDWLETYQLANDCGVAIDLTGYTIRWGVKTTAGAVIVATQTATITDAVNGLFTLSLARATTASIAPGVYEYDIEATSTTTRTTYIKGGFTVYGDITI